MANAAHGTGIRDAQTGRIIALLCSLIEVTLRKDFTQGGRPRCMALRTSEPILDNVGHSLLELRLLATFGERLVIA